MFIYLFNSIYIWVGLRNLEAHQKSKVGNHWSSRRLLFVKAVQQRHINGQLGNTCWLERVPWSNYLGTHTGQDWSIPPGPTCITSYCSCLDLPQTNLYQRVNLPANLCLLVVDWMHKECLSKLRPKQFLTGLLSFPLQESFYTQKTVIIIDLPQLINIQEYMLILQIWEVMAFKIIPIIMVMG